MLTSVQALRVPAALSRLSSMLPIQSELGMCQGIDPMNVPQSTSAALSTGPTWPTFPCPESGGTRVLSTPGHAGRVSTPARGGQKTPNERMQRLVRFLIHRFRAGDRRTRTGDGCDGLNPSLADGDTRARTSVCSGGQVFDPSFPFGGHKSPDSERFGRAACVPRGRG